MHIDIISDTVCPWCYVGKRRLEKAMALRPDIEFDITWRAFQLNPDMPLEGKDRREHYEAKFGSAERTAQLTDNITNVAREENLDLIYDKIDRMPNTLASHQLIRWSGSAGCQDDVVERLFEAYFTKGQDIGDTAVLSQVAADAGMDGELVSELLENAADQNLVKEEDALARQMGVTGVPCFIVDQKFSLVGAQEADAFLQVFDAAVREAAISVAEPSPAPDAD
jgi:predicted DsbA family dithiol-disulfide isomerase